MNGKIDLCIVTYDNVYKIPFPMIRQLDLFTVRYKNGVELVESLIRILGLPIDIDEVTDLYSQYVHSDTRLPIKYSGDNYDMDSVIDGYVSYLQKEQKRLSGRGIGSFMLRVDPGYRNFNFSDRHIAFLGKKYLKEDYRKIRDAYFLIKNEINVKINKITPRKKREEKAGHLDVEDNYIDFLLDSLNKDEGYYMMAMEELALMDLEELEKKLGYSDNAIIDGLRSDIYDQCDLDDIDSLTKLTKMDLENLKYIIKNGIGFNKKR